MIFKKMEVFGDDFSKIMTAMIVLRDLEKEKLLRRFVISREMLSRWVSMLAVRQYVKSAVNA